MYHPYHLCHPHAAAVVVEDVDVSEKFKGFEIVYSGSFLKDKGKAVRNLVRKI